MLLHIFRMLSTWRHVMFLGLSDSLSISSVRHRLQLSMYGKRRSASPSTRGAQMCASAMVSVVGGQSVASSSSDMAMKTPRGPHHSLDSCRPEGLCYCEPLSKSQWPLAAAGTYRNWLSRCVFMPARVITASAFLRQTAAVPRSHK